MANIGLLVDKVRSSSKVHTADSADKSRTAQQGLLSRLHIALVDTARSNKPVPVHKLHIAGLADRLRTVMSAGRSSSSKLHFAHIAHRNSLHKVRKN